MWWMLGVMSMNDTIEMWHSRCRPNPTDADFQVQLGCHFEEISEMMACLYADTGNDSDARFLEDLNVLIDRLAMNLKTGHMRVRITDRNDFLDSIADQVVTGIGAAHCAGMKPAEALRRVNSSNWSKFDYNGQPMRDQHGKIMKGPHYAPPDLGGCY
jgi:predicted HAD superfamily Cof-like phosphohydrolase